MFDVLGSQRFALPHSAKSRWWGPVHHSPSPHLPLGTNLPFSSHIISLFCCWVVEWLLWLTPLDNSVQKHFGAAVPKVILVKIMYYILWLSVFIWLLRRNRKFKYLLDKLCHTCHHHTNVVAMIEIRHTYDCRWWHLPNFDQLKFSFCLYSDSLLASHKHFWQK